MKTAIIYGPHDVRVQDVDIPEIGPQDVLVRVKASGICGSDVHRFLGTAYGRNYWTYPMNSGHEYCGDVVQVGSKVKTFRTGEKVTLGVAWTSGDLGAFSEFIRIPDADCSLHRLPQEMPYVDGALIETLLVALKSIYRPNPTPDERVLVLGAGPIGLCVLLCCMARGVEKIMVSEPSARRRMLAEKMGVTTANPSEENLEEMIMSATRGKGVDVTFECAGEEKTLNQAFTLTKKDGRISLIGHYRETPHLNVEDLVINSMNVFGPMGGHPFFDEAVQLVMSEQIGLAQMVSHTFALENAMEAFQVASDVRASVKVLFAPSQ